MSVSDLLSGSVDQARAVKLLEALVEESPVGKLLINKSHLLIYANPAAAAMWGVHHPTALANGVRTIHGLLPDDFEEVHRPLVTAWFEHPRPLVMSHRGPLKAKRVDTGDIFEVLIQLAPIYVGPSLAFSPRADDIEDGTYGAAYVIKAEDWGN